MPPRAPRAPRPELPLVARARAHADRTAIAAADGTFTYRELLDASAGVATCLLAGRADLAEARVAFLAPAGFRHVATQWGIWRAGGVAVPLAVSHPPPELEYVIRDAEAEIVRSEEHTSELQSQSNLVCRLLLEKKKKMKE